ncbi:hypothetical protein RFN58_19940 [Streptomyces iakyrus]|uniref:hypothetical protein n=1 Tax=Streptomyces iakyrus TaxID=68219 RepID=UPI0012FEDFFD|nr:hypothetical protein [Streptomyces iakyrus]
MEGLADLLADALDPVVHGEYLSGDVRDGASSDLLDRLASTPAVRAQSAASG